MNPKPILGVLVVLLLSSMVFAQEQYEDGIDYNGAPSWDYYKSTMGFFDRLAFGAPLTVVNGAQCSQTADYSKTSVATAPNLCWDNRDGGSPLGTGTVHQGVAYQIHELDTTNKVVKSQETLIQANTKGCLPAIVGKNYYRQAFYCGDTTKTCTKEVSICNTNEGVVRERTCLYNDGRSTVERVTDINWKDSSVGTCSTGTSTGTTLPSNQQTANAGSDGSGTTPSTGLKGSYSSIIVPDNAMPGETFHVTGTFKAETAGKYYLEATIFNAKLAAVSASGSKCDGSKQSAGEYVDLKVGEDVQMTFNIVAPTETGKKTVVVGAYTGCFKDGGKEVSSVADDINILDNTSTTTSSNNILAFVFGGMVIGAIIGGVMAGFTPVGFVWGAVVGIIIGWLASLI